MTRASNLAKTGEVVDTGGYAFRNRIINGAMDIWQRGTSFSNTTSTTTYTADRWSCYRGFYTTNISISQVTSLTIGTGINRNALRTQRTASDTNTAAIWATQSLESINSRDLAGQNVTLSFWARAGANFSATQLGVIVAYGTGTDEAARGAYTGYGNVINTPITLTTSFQKFSFNGTVAATANELSVLFFYSPTGTAGAADYFDITDVQLESGSIATAFERRPYGMELALCQRYYEYGFAQVGLYSSNAGNCWFGTTVFQVSKRAAPTISQTASYSANINSTTFRYTAIGSFSYFLNATGIGATEYDFNWTASAEL